jgi:hypothetical protein
MNRNQKEIYVLISDENRKFYKAIQQPNGDYSISKNSLPYPIKYTPSKIQTCNFEFGTNSSYFSLARTVTDSLDFIKDGAAILKNCYYKGKGSQEKTYITIIIWNGDRGIYELAYYGKVDFNTKVDKSKSGVFTVNCIDDSAWGVLSQNDSVEYAIECNSRNPKAIRVLIDEMNLENNYTYQTVPQRIPVDILNDCNTMPFVLINQSGDSFGIITKNQTLEYFTTLFQLKNSKSWAMSTAYTINGVKANGNVKFGFENNGHVTISLYTSNAQKFVIFNDRNLVGDKIYDINFDFTFNLAQSESIFLVSEVHSRDTSEINFAITPFVTNIYISTKTKTAPQVVYALRPLDAGKDIVEQATNKRFSINSGYFTTNNKSVLTSGDAIRGIPNSKIYTSFKDYFDSFNAMFFMALKDVNGDIFIEKAIDVYKQGYTIIDLGEAIDVDIAFAEEYDGNEIVVGSPKQDYRHPSGRLEFNSENTFSLPRLSVNKKIEFIPKYRLGCYDIIFLVLDYQGQNTQDNNGDKSVYVLDITDEQGTAIDNIETFENVNIDIALLEPVIKSPFDNDALTNNKPFLKGIAIPLSVVNIYIDTVIDGGTVADANGNWSYNIAIALTPFNPPTTTGRHIIQATYTDLSGPNSLINLFIDTVSVMSTVISYPEPNSNLYNNKPLLKGSSQAGTNIDISLDGVFVATVVTDNSNKWEYKIPVISNGAHLLSINAGADTANFNVDTNVSFPLITYIGSELDGFVLVNNMPLIEGVAIPGTVVEVWLNYITYAKLGTVVADSNGNWSLQVTPVSYPDPVTGSAVVLAPIQNGVNVISTSLVNHSVGIVVTGYKLNRPLYSSITGVPDNTVFNTRFSPKRILENQYPRIKPIVNQQPLDKIVFQKPDKNGNLRTVLNGIVVSENSDVPVSSLGTPLFLMEKANIKVKSYKSFAKTLYDFSNGGIVKFTFKGTDIFALPIGNMKISGLRNQVQEWSLLLSPLTTYNSLLNLSKSGLSINLKKFSMFHSNYNSLHFVTYNFPDNPNLNFKTIYDDWFSNRNTAWLYNPDYIQKYQTGEVIRDQVISNGVGSLVLKQYLCFDGREVATYNYNPVNPAPIPVPHVCLECEIDFSLQPENQYFFVLWAGDTPIAISERIETRDRWEKTILIKSKNSTNKVGSFFSTGFQTVLRVEGHIEKLQPSVDTSISTDDIGNTITLFGNVARKRNIRFGNAYGLPDYLYLKCADAIALDGFSCEDILYSLPEGGSIDPAEETDGHPLYYYVVEMHLQENQGGKEFPNSDGETNEGVVLVVDAEAVGLPAGQLINISL